jgi:putative ABC transport system permease protein
MSVYTAESRTKELGIRKALGSSSSGIFRLLSKETLYVVFVANVIGWPVAYYVMTRWLNAFAYRTDLSPLEFALGGLASVSIALVTVSWQSLKAAWANPIDSLRYE